MSILKVARMGHPVLREARAADRPTEIRSPAFQKLIDDMIETMDEYDGIGLAAPQVHESVRLFVPRSRTAATTTEDRPVHQPGDHRRSARDGRGLGRLPEHSRHPRRACRAPRIVVRGARSRGKPFEMSLKNFPGQGGPARNRSSRRRAVPRPHGVARQSLTFLDEFQRYEHRLRLATKSGNDARDRRPKVTLRNAPSAPYNGAIAAARTCYAPRVITAAEITDRQRDTIGKLTFDAGHHTVYQHANFEFGLEQVSRQFVWTALHSYPFYNSEQQSQRYVKLGEPKAYVPPIDGEARRCSSAPWSRRGRATRGCRRSSRTTPSRSSSGCATSRRKPARIA